MSVSAMLGSQIFEVETCAMYSEKMLYFASSTSVRIFSWRFAQRSSFEFFVAF